MTAGADVLLYVQHLLGTGHLQRAAAISRALAGRGLRVLFVSGGRPLRGLETGAARFLQLPALQSRDATFSALVDEAGEVVGEAWKAARAARLLAAFEEARPRLLVTEMFPFGRRQLRFELLPLLAAARRARPRPLVVCSLRDILNPTTRQDKIDWIVETLNRDYDRILVHGDPDFVALEASFADLERITTPIDYTGYVAAAPAAPRKPATGGGEVLVSAGGGRAARPLIEAALAARPLGPLAAAPWRLLAGAYFPDGDFRHCAAAAPAGVTLERARRDFPALLAGCRLSISQAGYNTLVDVLQAGPPAVLVPFAAAAEAEQSLRARLLEARGAAVVVAESELSGARLDAGLRRALAQRRRAAGALRLRLDGAETTAALLARALDMMSS